ASVPHLAALIRVLHSFPTRRSSDLVEVGLYRIQIKEGYPEFVGGSNRNLSRRPQSILYEIRHQGAGLVFDGFQRGKQILFGDNRSEEHTSELQSRENLVCRLLLEKK